MLPCGAVLVGPVVPDDEVLAESLASILLDLGHGVVLLHTTRSSTPEPSPLRFDVFDRFLGDRRSPGRPGRALNALFPGAPAEEGNSNETCHWIPVASSGEDGRLLVRWAEETGEIDSEQLMEAVFHAADPSPSSSPGAVRAPSPLPWPTGFPSLAQWCGSRLRCEGWKRSAQGEEAAAADLFAAARRVESVAGNFSKIVEAGILSQLPGLAGEPLELLHGLLASAVRS